MKAVLCTEFGPPDNLKVKEVPAPQIRAGEVRVGVRAAGVNFPDVLMVQGLYQMKPPFPFSPGLEVAGDVLEVGPGVENLKVGDRVIGIVNYGGFAEQVIVPAMMTIPMPDNMPYEHGAVFPIVYGTSDVALNHRARIQSGETLLVLGAAGGVGLTAVEIGKLMGATVIAAASTPAKLELTREYGADHTINYTTENLRERVQEITNGVYADVIYDPVGGAIFDEAIRAIGWEGRYLVIGFASGTIPQVAVNRVLLKNSSIVGTFWGAYAINRPRIMADSLLKLMKWYGEGKLKPHVDARFSLYDASAALNALKNREVKGKVVLLV